MENEIKSPKSAFLHWGLPLGLANAAVYSLVYAFDTPSLVSFTLGGVLLVLNGFAFIGGLWYARKNAGGYAEFKDLFGVWMGLALGLTLVVNSFNLLLYKVIDPTLTEQVQVWSQEKAVSMMESMGTPQEEVDKAIAKMERQKQVDPFSPKTLVFTLFASLLGYAVLGAIFAMVFKKSKPLFAPSNES